MVKDLKRSEREQLPSWIEQFVQNTYVPGKSQDEIRDIAYEVNQRAKLFFDKSIGSYVNYFFVSYKNEINNLKGYVKSSFSKKDASDERKDINY